MSLAAHAGGPERSAARVAAMEGTKPYFTPAGTCTFVYS
jgi:hypothetical protein